VADRQGAVFMLFTPSDGDAPSPGGGAPGHVGCHGLYATDWTGALAFHAGQFGWTKDMSVDIGSMGTYQLFAAGDAIGGMMNKPAGIPAPAWLYYFNVAAIDGAAERVRKIGGQVRSGPHPVPGGS
jgi:uncharacterized protein